MQPPVKGHVTMRARPRLYRTAARSPSSTRTGKVLDTTVVYPTLAAEQSRGSEAQSSSSSSKSTRSSIIAIGNGHSQPEIGACLPRSCSASSAARCRYMVVNEAGASVYSASQARRSRSFPSMTCSLRSAVSIARRLQDPLAELVKIDPKSVGVGQYQHDMPAEAARRDAHRRGRGLCQRRGRGREHRLGAAAARLRRGLSAAATAKNVVAYREAHGAFTGAAAAASRSPKLGPKAFQQCAGFLRVPGAERRCSTTRASIRRSYEAAQELLALFAAITLADVRDGEAPARPCGKSEGDGRGRRRRADVRRRRAHAAATSCGELSQPRPRRARRPARRRCCARTCSISRT